MVSVAVAALGKVWEAEMVSSRTIKGREVLSKKEHPAT